ncbi:TolC family protein [Halomonas cupida]|uniref:TolC family protein n=1 Tax=Halomonas cupida TaxID=44933 RepID=UPI0039B6DF18
MAMSPGSIQAMTLSEAVSRGLAINPSVMSAEAEARSVATEVDIARDSYWPSVSMSAGPENAVFGEIGYDVTATQVLYDWGRIAAQVDTASAEHRESLAALKVTSDEVALDIIELYLDVIAAQRRVAVVEEYLQRLDGLAAMTQERDVGGYSDRSESERASLDLARAREQLSIERGSLSEAQRQLSVLLQRELLTTQEPVPHSDLLETLESPQVLDDAIAEAPALNRSQAGVVAAEAQLDESRAALKPQLNLEGSLLRREIGGQVEDDQVIALRVRMEPIQGLSNWRRAEAATQRVEASKYTHRATLMDLERTVSGLLEQRDVLMMRQDVLLQQVRSAEGVAATYREQFDAGLRDVADLLSIERERFEAARQSVDLKVELYRLQYQAASQLGMLDAVMPGIPAHMAGDRNE